MRIVTPSLTILSIVLAATVDAEPFAYITNANDGTISIIDTATKSVTAVVPVSPFPLPSGVAVSPDGSKVYVGHVDEMNPIVSVLDVATIDIVSTYNVGPARPTGIAVNPAGSALYVTNVFGPDGQSVSLVDPLTGSTVSTTAVGTGPQGVVVSPDCRKIYVANGGDRDVSVLDTATHTAIKKVDVGAAAPFGIDINQVGDRVYVGTLGALAVLDATTDTFLASIPTGGTGPSIGVAVIPDGSRVYVSSNQTDTVAVFDTATASILTTVHVGDCPSGVDATPDGKEVYVANTCSANVSVIDTSSNTVVATIPVGVGPIAFGRFISGTTRIVPCPPLPGSVSPSPAPIPALSTLGILALVVSLAVALVRCMARKSRRETA